MRLLAFVAFVAFYAIDVVRASIRVAWDVVTPAAHRRPAVFVVPLDLRRDLAIAWLANLINFTPGTLALDVTPDRRAILVHDLFAPDLERARARIKHLEGWVRRILP